MKGIFLFIVFLALGISLHAQADTAFRLIKTIKGDIVEFTVDNLDNIYILNSHNQVKKLNENGDSVGVFNDVRKYGKATLIDVSNPLKVLLYYKDFATIVVLDRFLNAVSNIDLRKQDIFQAKAVALSYDNNVWVYDELENKLKKIDDEGKKLLETPDFRQLFDRTPSPQKIFDQDKRVYLYDSSLAIYVFDYYGALKNKLLISKWNNFIVTGKYIYGSTGDILHRYEISSFRVDEWKLPAEIAKGHAFNFSSSRLYALKDGVLEVYSFK